MPAQHLTLTDARTDTAATGDATPERIADLADSMVQRMHQATTEIAKINDRTRLLSLNAQIEAARAGGATGAAFGVVASAMKDLSDKTSVVAEDMARETQQASQGLRSIIQTLATNVRGLRLSDLALTNIDLIDRNLYERSCDVRWWATDAAPVAALADGSSASRQYCAQRLGVILNSYTVYYDLVVCGLDGIVVANGRPDQFRSLGLNCASEAWFRSALETRSGEEFGFQGLHTCRLVGGQRALIYSCCIRSGGDAHGQPLGALGIVFNWDALAQTIVENTPLSAEERSQTRVCLVDGNGQVLADTHGRQITETLMLSQWPQVRQQKKGFLVTTVDGRPCCIGHASSPGYETYTTGWYSLLIQTSGK